MRWLHAMQPNNMNVIVYGTDIVTVSIAWVHPVYFMNALDSNKPINMGCDSACKKVNYV